MDLISASLLPWILSDCCRVEAGERLFLPVETKAAEPAFLSLKSQLETQTLEKKVYLNRPSFFFFFLTLNANILLL